MSGTTTSGGHLQDEVEEFLTAWASDRLQSAEHTMSEDISVAFSMAGAAQGKSDACSLLRSLRPDFSLSSTVATNAMEVLGDRCHRTYATVHHLVGYRESNTVYPLCFGGKYAFETEAAAGRIRSVRFDLEYSSGNTHWTHGTWDLRASKNAERLIATQPLRRSESPHALGPREVMNRFFWALDAIDVALLRDTASEAIHFTRTHVGGPPTEADGIDAVSSLVAAYRHPSSKAGPFSVAVVGETVGSENEVRITGRRLNPGDTGNKHRGGRTTHALFFDEDVEVVLQRPEGEWRVLRVALRRREEPDVRGLPFTLL